MSGVWPERIIPIYSITRSTPTEKNGRSPWLDGEILEEVLNVVTINSPNLLAKPAMLDNNAVRLIALTRIGVDGVNHRDMLILRVTNEINRMATSLLRLTIVPYGPVAGSYDFVSITPDRASDDLDAVVEEIKRIKGLTPTGAKY